MTPRDHSRGCRAHGVLFLLVLGLGLVSEACSIPPPVAPRIDRVAWTHEPRISTNAPELRVLVRQAIAEWGWGQYVAECLDADICITRDAMESGRTAWGRASWEPAGERRCQAAVIIASFPVVAHELGHCFGLGHSEDRRSLMHARTGDRFQQITRADRAALRAIQDAVPRHRAAELRASDGWFEIRHPRRTVVTVEGPR